MGVKSAIASKFRNAAGQTSICANHIFVQGGVYDAFTQCLADPPGQ
jgi:succinate-semialdehyde dehydrogenase / glutarate-semialdehyde dehydrogenase